VTKPTKWTPIVVAAAVVIGLITSISCIVIEMPDRSGETTDKRTKEQQREEPPGRVDVLSHQSYVEDGYYYVVGEVQNNTGHKVELVEIAATFYDSAGQVVATDSNPVEMHVLAPGQKSFFEVSNVGEDKESTGRIARYELKVQ
jgi:hypothetical protein